QREKKTPAGALERQALAPHEAISRTSAQGRWPHAPHPAGSVQRPSGLVNPEREPPKLQTALQEAEHYLQSGNYRLALTTLERLLHQEPRNLSALTLSAQAHASLGHYDEATHRCQQAIAADSLAVFPY